MNGIHMGKSCQDGQWKIVGQEMCNFFLTLVERRMLLENAVDSGWEILKSFLSFLNFLLERESLSCPDGWLADWLADIFVWTKVWLYSLSLQKIQTC